MGLDRKKLQKKKAKKAAKDKARLTKSKRASFQQGISYQSEKIRALKAPIYECWESESLYDQGLGHVVITRRSGQSEILVAAFLVDMYCLGVKNALLELTSEHKYQQYIEGLRQRGGLISCHPTCARKLVEGAETYAQELGFSPHKDYKIAKKIFGDLDSAACPSTYVFGQNGKPFYIAGPNDSPAFQRKVMQKLSAKMVRGEADYMLALDEID